MHRGRRHRAIPRAALSLLVALSVLVSVLVAGHRYFYCTQMDEVSLDECCNPLSDSEGRGEPGLMRGDCCKSERFAPSSPAVRTAPEPPVQAPASVLLPIHPAPIAPALGEAPVRARVARAGPPGMDSREHRLRLMVSLT